jgi:ABC-type methionine transport system permease subunit
MHSQPPSRGEVPLGRVLTSQNVYTASSKAKQQIEDLLVALELGDIQCIGSHMEGTSQTLYELLISQSLPELIRHVLLLNKAMVECGTRLYLKIGSTGMGGMGLNIPYTHSEDKPSAQLLTKTAVAFAHTGLLFLMARTAGGPIVMARQP